MSSGYPKNGRSRPKERSSPLRRSVAVLFLLGIGLVAGVLLRPHLGQYRRSLDASLGPPGPKLPNLYQAKAQQFELLDPLATDVAVVYLGDSLTDWMAISELVRAEGGRVLSRAISGDTTSGMIRRLRRSFPQDAEVCFLLVGFNDLSQGASVEDTASRVEQICRLLIECHQTKRIVVESLLPAPGDYSQLILDLNERLTRMAAAHPAVAYLDLYPAFVVNGQRNAALYAGDSAHLNGQGTMVRLRREVEYLRETMPELKIRFALSDVE
jgi:lysophospholipase L1-like esterase